MKKITEKNIFSKIIKIAIILLLVFFPFFLFSCSTSQSKVITEYDYNNKLFLDAIKNNEESTALFYYFQPGQKNSYNKELLVNLILKNLDKELKEKNLYFVYREIKNLQYFGINKKDEMKNLILDILKNEKNYYIYNSYINFIKTYLQDIYNSLKSNIKLITQTNFSNIKFVQNYSDIEKLLVTVYNDKGLSIKNGAYYPDINLGTGFFIDNSLVVTNNHVIKSNKKEYSKLYIELNNNKYNAHILFKDEKYDIAILQVDYFNKNFKYIKLNTNLSIGDTVIACGSPAGLDKTFTKGIISNTKRKLLELTEVFQTDVAINPGNSGGPVLDSKFNLVGIAFAGLPQFQNINFILPISIFNQIAFLSRNLTEFKRGWLGIYVDESLTCRYVYPKSNLHFLNILNKKIKRIGNLQNINDINEIQKYVSLIPYGSIENIIIDDKSYFLPIMPRPNYPLKTLVNIEDKNNLYIPLLGINVKKIDKTYKITEIYEKQFNFQLGVEKGDLIKILKVEIDDEKKIINVKLYIKYYSKGGIETSIMIYSTFESSNFI